MSNYGIYEKYIQFKIQVSFIQLDILEKYLNIQL